jgi:ubiquinone/menaquinone biosynthesis C-methylase UbiE
MFASTAQYYDKIYAFKDYRAEAEAVTCMIREHLRTTGRSLLDVACGTGCHLEHLREEFTVAGLDICPQLLAVARRRHPDISFHEGDMLDFDLGSRFDIVTCLFSSIGYVKTLSNLAQALACMTRHLHPGGVLLVEPWFTPDAWRSGTVHALLVDEPELKIARASTSLAKGRLSYFDLHYLIATPEGTRHCVERHELGLFETGEMRRAMEGAGLETFHDPAGITGRGIFIGRRPLGRGHTSG